MRLFLSNLIFLMFFCFPLCGEENSINYVVKVSGIKIGELNWEIKLETDKYTNKLRLKSKGLLSALYNFKGEYYSEGRIQNNELVSKKYTHFWKTKKATKRMDLNFKNKRLEKITQIPVEEEAIRLNVFSLDNINDPLTSFLKIMMNEKTALVVDGRRLYTMETQLEEKIGRTTIKISNYINLWADHKRNKFEKIIFEKNTDETLPYKMLIYFDGRVFNLEKN